MIAFLPGVERGPCRLAQSPMLSRMEHFFTCPHCWEQISMVLDTSVKEQTYVEDCEVCCRPIQVRYTAEKEMVVSFESGSVE